MTLRGTTGGTLMAKAAFETPRIPDFPEIPVIVEGAMAHSRPFVAAPDHQQALGFPGELVDDWHDTAIAKMGELLGKYRGLRVFLDSCVKCGACTDKCHYYLGTSDPKNMPVARQDLLRKVYRRHFTLAGRLFPKLVGAADLTEEVLEDWYRYFHQCSQCRRCSVFCPYGIDTAEVSMAGREILASVGLGQKYSNEIIGKVHKIGNNLGLPQPALADTLEGLEEDVEEETGGGGAVSRSTRRGPRCSSSPRPPTSSPSRTSTASSATPRCSTRPASAGRSAPGPRRRRTSVSSSAATRTCARWRCASARRRWSSG